MMFLDKAHVDNITMLLVHATAHSAYFRLSSPTSTVIRGLLFTAGAAAVTTTALFHLPVIVHIHNIIRTICAYNIYGITGNYSSL